MRKFTAKTFHTKFGDTIHRSPVIDDATHNFMCANNNGENFILCTAAKSFSVLV